MALKDVDHMQIKENFVQEGLEYLQYQTPLLRQSERVRLLEVLRAPKPKVKTFFS